MDTFLKDLKHSLRMFLQTPGFTITAIAALALGIGANTAIFSVVNAVLLRPLPYPDSERVVSFLLTSPNGSGPGASATKFNVWREQTSVFQDVTAYRFGVVNLTGVDPPEQLHSGLVTEGYFRIFGLPVTLGRGFTADEVLPRGNHVAVLSGDLWQRRFGGDPQMIGKTLSLSGNSYQVVGIVAPGYKTEVDPPVDVYI